ncbi:related to aspartic protease [Serendipita indica DSM 11827]|uniref:Related to aspartic protease n=1 Tax=Serendipita indica (strain DSM 11827) TaxID=1109443 RepID=G4TZ52_SERID|nr:related to aspartic protease [Serendipita indica DSM 11827]
MRLSFLLATTLLFASSATFALPNNPTVARRDAGMAPVTVPLIRRRLEFEKRDHTHEESTKISVNPRGTYGKHSKRSAELGRRALSTVDLWIRSSSCVYCASHATGALFNQTESSTFSYVQGGLDGLFFGEFISGILGSDVVQMGQFQVASQVFGLATSVRNTILAGNSSGIMGLGFRPSVITGAHPWWQQASNGWDAPQMSFYFTRSRSGPYASIEEPGGQFTLGGTNSSLFQGSINFNNLVHEQDWVILMDEIGIANNASIQISSPSQSAAIDMGIEGIGGPSSVLDQFYSLIPGATRSQISSSLYVIPCNTTVQATLMFGGRTYTMQASDLIGSKLSGGQQCIGTFFVLTPRNDLPSSDMPAWRIGSAFLKNVYTVLQSEPAAIGFATLRDNVQEFGTLGFAGLSIDENGHANAAASPRHRTITLGSGGVFATSVLWAVVGLAAVMS